MKKQQSYPSKKPYEDKLYYYEESAGFLFLYSTILPSFMKTQTGMLLCKIFPLNSFPTYHVQDHKSLEITAVKLTCFLFTQGRSPKEPI